MSTTLPFGLLEDGTIRVRVGTNSNCGGVAVIHVKITTDTSKEFSFRVSECEGKDNDDFASAILAELREDIFEGAKQAFDESETDIGIVFELLDVFVNYADFKGNKFKTAGYLAVGEWLKWYAQMSQAPSRCQDDCC